MSRIAIVLIALAVAHVHALAQAPSGEAALAEGIAHLRTGDSFRALITLNDAVGQFSTQPDASRALARAHAYRALAYMRMDQPERANAAALVVRDGVLVRAGVRGDWQAGEGLLTSPRTTITIRGRGFVFASGAGLFVDSWSPAFLLETVRRDGIGLTTWVAPNVPASGDVLGGNIDRSIGDLLATRVAPGLARRRDIVVQTSISRQFGRVGAGIEHKWTRGISLAGATRARTAAGLVDVIEGDRRLARQHLHARAGVSSRTVSVTAHYELVRSLDDTDGAFMLPARQDDVGGEWARSTGLPGHNLSLVASFAFPGAVRAFVSATAASGSPYSIISGRDAEGLAAFADRAGARRNATTGPAYRNVSMYASRRIPVPPAGGLAFHVGVRAENLFDAANVTSVGSVAGTTWLGQPLAALSGRSTSVWLSMTR